MRPQKVHPWKVGCRTKFFQTCFFPVDPESCSYTPCGTVIEIIFGLFMAGGLIWCAVLGFVLVNEINSANLDSLKISIKYQSELTPFFIRRKNYPKNVWNFIFCRKGHQNVFYASNSFRPN